MTNLTQGELRRMHVLARELWARDQLSLPSQDRYDWEGEALHGKLRYQAEARRLILSERKG